MVEESARSAKWTIQLYGGGDYAPAGNCSEWALLYHRNYGGICAGASHHVAFRQCALRRQPERNGSDSPECESFVIWKTVHSERGWRGDRAGSVPALCDDSETGGRSEEHTSELQSLR